MTGHATGLYEAVVGPLWQILPQPIRRAHQAGGFRAAGLFRIEAGRGLVARVLSRLCRLPPAGAAIPVQLSVTPDAGTERWTRQIGTDRILTSQRGLAGGVIAERFGLLELRFRISPAADSLRYEHLVTRLCCGPFSLPMPKWLAPRVVASEEIGTTPGCSRVRVAVFLPVVGLLLAYEGELTLQRSAPW